MIVPGLVPMVDDLSEFGQDPWWVIGLKTLFIFLILVLLTLFNIWWERRVVARMQHRIGPNVNGPFGLLQSLADGVKLALKEDITPTAADKVVFVLAPIISATTAFVTFAVIPFGPVVDFFGVETPLQLTDMPVAVLFVMAIASVGIYGIARDLAAENIRVNTILPGIFDTPLLAGAPQNVRDALGASVLNPKRLGNPAEYAQLAMTMIECGYFNGEDVRLDGGIRMTPR